MPQTRIPKTVVPPSTKTAVNKIQARIRELDGTDDGRVQGLVEALGLIMVAVVEDGEQ